MTFKLFSLACTYTEIYAAIKKFLDYFSNQKEKRGKQNFCLKKRRVLPPSSDVKRIELSFMRLLRHRMHFLMSTANYFFRFLSELSLCILKVQEKKLKGNGKRILWSFPSLSVIYPILCFLRIIVRSKKGWGFSWNLATMQWFKFSLGKWSTCV